MQKLLFLCTFFCQFAYAQNYSVALIPESLKINADVVKRAEEIRVIVKSFSKATIKHKYVLTILNEAGAEWATYHMSYNKSYSPDHISGNLYDANGKEIKSVKKKDISDFSSVDESSLMTDDRVKVHNFHYAQYPYTIAYEDEEDMDGIFFLPSWHPIEGFNYAVMQSSFIVETPANFNLRYKQVLLSQLPSKDVVDEKNIYKWELNNQSAIVKEPLQPSLHNILPSVYIAPSQFEIYDYKGDMSSWLTLGNFIKKLNENKQGLPDAIKRDVHLLTDTINSTKQKVLALYKYLQQNTRYISVQMGIGGWQPFDANYVAQKKYGDCKALSNYMISLLKETSIPAKYVLVSAGSNSNILWDDFSAPYFNHAIVCVPMAKDTVWLECTSPINIAGFMGSFTGSRKVLLVDDDGGHVVNTPQYNAADNLQNRKVDATVMDDGTLKATVVTEFKGIQIENVQSLMHQATEKQKQDYLNSILGLPTYSVEKFDYKESKNDEPIIHEFLTITAANYATITGKRLFISPNFFNKSGYKLGVDEDRKSNIFIPNSYVDVDSIQIKIPADYSIESMPAPVTLSTKYGNYKMNFVLKDNIIFVVRYNERNGGTYNKDEYKMIAEFFNAIYKADRSKIVLTKKTD